MSQVASFANEHLRPLDPTGQAMQSLARRLLPAAICCRRACGAKMSGTDLPEGVIKLRLSRVDQLFNSLDPSPFHERDLDTNAEEYIVAWAREIPASAALHIRIELPAEELRRARARGVETALGNYFGYRADLIDNELRELFRLGRLYLSVGLIVLMLCLLASQLLRTSFADNPFMRVVEESLLILGWVANWKPLETFLYDWWPIRRRLKLYRRLAAAPTELAAEATT